MDSLRTHFRRIQLQQSEEGTWYLIHLSESGVSPTRARITDNFSGVPQILKQRYRVSIPIIIVCCYSCNFSKNALSPALLLLLIDDPRRLISRRSHDHSIVLFITSTLLEFPENIPHYSILSISRHWEVSVANDQSNSSVNGSTTLLYWNISTWANSLLHGSQLRNPYTRPTPVWICFTGWVSAIELAGCIPLHKYPDSHQYI